MRRIIITAAILALATAACSPGQASPGDDTPTSSSPLSDTSTTSAASVPTTSPVPTTLPSPSTTTAPNPTTTAPSPTTSTTKAPPATPKTQAVAPYFWVDEAGHPNRTGPFLVPVHREVPYTLGVARSTIEQLLAGPTGGEESSVPAISTAIPDGVKLLALTIDDGVATIDLSSEFEADADSAAVVQRIAQVVHTLTRFPTVHSVLFHQNGEAISVQTGDGQLVSRPVTRDDYLDFQAILTIESPAYGGRGGNPLHVTGVAAVFEAMYNFALVDANGLILEEGTAMTLEGQGWGAFDLTIDYEVDHEQMGAIIVWTYSQEDGQQIDTREYPVLLVP